jgi:hypothetical protein
MTIMLKGTKTHVSTQTTYEIPGNLIVIEDLTSDKRFRPTAVIVGERDGQIETITFSGPRQLPGPQDSRDMAARAFSAPEIFGHVKVEKAAGNLLDKTLALHLTPGLAPLPIEPLPIEEEAVPVTDREELFRLTGPASGPREPLATSSDVDQALLRRCYG